MEIKPIIKEDFIVLDEEETLSEMFGKLKQFEKRLGLVFRKNKYLGLVEKKRLFKSRLDISRTKLSGWIKRTPVLKEDADLLEAAYLLYQSNLDYVPVERDKKIVGIINGLDLARRALELPELKKAKVGDVHLLKLEGVKASDPLGEVISLMYKEKVDHVPVFDKGELYGVISYKDLIRKYLNWSPKRDVSAKFNKMASTRSAEADMPHLASLPVSSFSTNDNLLVTTLGENLRKAVDLMGEKKVSDLLVLEEKKFLGILTISNILRKIASLRVPKNYNIQFIGLNAAKLEPYQKYNFKKIAANEAFKLQRKINNEFVLVIHLKEYGKGGKQQKYSVHMRLEYPGKIITSEQEDWDLETALRKAFNNAKNEVKSRFRGDSSRRKSYE